MAGKTRAGYWSEWARDKSYKEIVDCISGMRKKVYNLIDLYGPLSNEVIASMMNVYPHQISPRTGELRDMGVVEFAEYGKSMDGKKTVSLWRIKAAEPVQLNLTF